MSNTTLTNPVFTGDVLEAQRQLRAQLLDGPTIRHKPARDLAAHMLLHLDDLKGCWSVATNWLRTELGCQRVDTGFGLSTDVDYFPGFAEAKNADYDVPSFGGMAVDNRDPAMQAMWLGARPIIFADIKQDRRVTAKLRQRMSGARTKSKFASALRTQKGSYGLICADWTEHLAPYESGLMDCFEHTVSDVFSPIIAMAKQIDDLGFSRRDMNLVPKGTTSLAIAPVHDVSLHLLTGSELEVARLVAQGLSYKEIARIRGRSLSTIDHQLRSIRQKIGVPSTAALVSLLAKIDVWSQ